jgi:segregation and condensation protein B
MSSRKKKREKRGETEAPDEVIEAAEPEPEPESAVEEDAPAVSDISELKPRRKKKRADQAESEPEAEATEEPEVVEAEADEEEEDDEPVDDTAKEAPKTREHLKRVIESLIFVSDQIITAQQLGRITKTKIGDVRETLVELATDYQGRGIDLVEVNGGYQFRSSAASAAYVRALVAQRPVRLTRAQLETLALIAYRQPITRPEVDDVRGVDSGSAIKVLLERELIKILGRKEDAGRPLLYGTTPFFLEFFGMNTMEELPTLREFTELSEEHRELFRAKTNELGDLSAEAEVPLTSSSDDDSAERWAEETVLEAEGEALVPGSGSTEHADDSDMAVASDEREESESDEREDAEIVAEDGDLAENDDAGAGDGAEDPEAGEAPWDEPGP